MKLALSAIAVYMLAGCATMSRVANIEDEACRTGFTQAVSKILVSEGERRDVADNVADQTVRHVRFGNIGPRPFMASSPYGTDYFFFVDLKNAQCLLRLYGRQKGMWSYTNDLTYIATEPLAACRCEE